MPATERSRLIRWWIVGGIGVLLACGVAAWWGLAATVGKPAYEMTGYDVISSSRIRVQFQVNRPTGRAMDCDIVALDKGHATVGSVTARVPASNSKVNIGTVLIRTTGRAVTGDVAGCDYVTH